MQLIGKLVVGMAHTSPLGLKPCDEFEIKIGNKQIRSIPVGASDEED